MRLSQKFEISALAQQLTHDILNNQKSFAIRVTRVGTHPYTSQDVAIQIGNDIVQATHARVNLNTPDFELYIEIREKNAFLFTEKIKGAGGLPLGTQGKILALVKDPSSLCAAWYLMRRGCNILIVTGNQLDKEAIRSFLASWYADAEILSLDETNKEFYHQLSSLVSEKKCDAIVTDYTFEKPSQALSDFAQLKKNSVVPILTPLITMTPEEIENQCKNRGINR